MGCVTAILVVGLLCTLGQCGGRECAAGFNKVRTRCDDIDECEEGLCGNYTKCVNTNGSYYCNCLEGFKHTEGLFNFTGVAKGQCVDINECRADPHRCGEFGKCVNAHGNYSCNCSLGYTNTSIHRNCTDIDECKEAKDKNQNLCGDKGRCENRHGSYWCQCSEGYTNYGNNRTKCSELSCDQFNGAGKPTPSLEGLADILLMMKTSCLALSNPSSGSSGGNTDGVTLLEKLLTATEHILSPGELDSSDDVSGLLGTMENAIALIGPLLKDDVTTMNTTETDVVIAVQRGETPPTGPVHLTNENATLDTDWTTAAGMGSYSGFALASLVSYKDLEKSVNRSFDDITGYEKDGVNASFKVFSKVVSVVVSNPDTQNLSSPVQISLRRLEASEDKSTYVCAHWTESGSWSTHGCSEKESNATHTVCTCDHLSSFAVLMALYPMKHPFALQVLTQIGLTISLLCLVICILTFKFCRSIQGTRTTIHLHLCICLFMADLVFLAGISKTKPVGGCRFVAALLHYFFLGLFTWMLLEGVQLYRMVVLVFNATIRPLYLLAFGYGAPLIIVIISAIIRPTGYGTDEYCWLSLKDGLIWSFFGPVCLIIVFNVVFFIVTVWKLAQKFTSLNPDLSKLHKIKAFTVTAIAQMCILGLMWVFGAFLFQEGSTVTAYIFTILNSLQGALVFIMHCLLSKQVRDEYAHFLSCLCPAQKKRYSDFSSTNPSSSQSHASRSGQHTGESQI